LLHAGKGIGFSACPKQSEEQLVPEQSEEPPAPNKVKNRVCQNKAKYTCA
jgi:hypothetical protein